MTNVFADPPPVNPAALGQIVKRIREENGINQRELSRRSGVSQATISRLEAGISQEVRSSTLKHLADALGVSTSALLNEKQDDANSAHEPSSDLVEEDPVLQALTIQEITDWYYQLSPMRQKWLYCFAGFLAMLEQGEVTMTKG